jgi:hypothetical protein
MVSKWEIKVRFHTSISVLQHMVPDKPRVVISSEERQIQRSD